MNSPVKWNSILIIWSAPHSMIIDVGVERFTMTTSTKFYFVRKDKHWVMSQINPKQE